MSKLFHVSVGACAFMLVVVGMIGQPTALWAAPVGPQAGQSGKACPVVHKIALGENLTWIAAEYEVTIEALIEENGIGDADVIVENQALCIPARTRGSLDDWGAYGVPGHSYDPSLLNKQESGEGPSQSPNQSPNQSPSQSSDAAGWQPAGSYDMPGKADDTNNKPEVTKQGGYWKDDLRYPRQEPSDFDPDDIDPSDSDEPRESLDPVIPDEENGDGNGETG